MSAQTTPPTPALFPVKAAGPTPPPVGELATFEAIADLDAINDAIQQIDRQLTANGNRGKGRVTIHLDMEAAGFIRDCKTAVDFKVSVAAKQVTKVKAAHVDGQLHFVDEEAQKELDELARKQAEENGRANAARGQQIVEEILGPKKGKGAPKGEGATDGE